MQALGRRLAADEAALALAFKEKCPDMELWAGYDAFWQERPLRSMVGMRLNVPRPGRRDGAILEAQSKLAQRRAELDRLVDQASYQVQEAYAAAH